jgi:hypothetical protein
MRKLSMNRPSKLNLAAKKVSPPIILPPPGEGLASPTDVGYDHRYGGGDNEITIAPRLRSFDNSTAPPRPAAFREPFFPPMCSPPATSPSPSVAGEDGGSSSSAYSSSSLLSSVSSPGVPPLHGGGSRHSVSSMDSGWGGHSGPLATASSWGENGGGHSGLGDGGHPGQSGWSGGGQPGQSGPPPASVMRQCRNSNSSLNSDRTNYSGGAPGEEVAHLRSSLQQGHYNQRRLSSIRKGCFL